MKKMTWLGVPLLLLAVGTYPIPASSAQQQQLSNADQQFMRQADEISLAEVQLGKIAQSNSSNKAVQLFGERMVKDHSRLNRELRELARNQGIKLPTQLDQEHQQMVNRLSSLTGTAFDREYAKDMVPGHKKAIQKFEDEATNGQDPQVKAWAKKAIPILKEHLRLAEEMQKQVR